MIQMEGQSVVPLSHHLSIPLFGKGAAVIYTVDLTPYEAGAFLVSCRELPEVSTFGVNEEEALTMAELAIKEALGPRRSSPEFPY